MNAPQESSSDFPLLPRAAPVVKLIVTSGKEPQSIPLRRPIAVIGGRPGSKVQLVHPAVSALHCLIVNTGSKVYLRDLLSDSGTFLNDLKAEHELLDDGDVIRVGPWEFRVTMSTASAHDLDDFTGIDFEPAPAGVGFQQTDNGKLIKLNREVTLVGRKNGCDLLLPDRRVSRVHAAVFDYLNHPAIADLLSENGIVVEGKTTRFAVLDAGTEFELGPFKFLARTVPPLPHFKPDSKST